MASHSAVALDEIILLEKQLLLGAVSCAKMPAISNFLSLVLLCITLSLAGQNQSNFLQNIYSSNQATIIAPGIVSTTMGEYSPTYDPIRKELYFMRRTPELFDYRIYVTKLGPNGWTVPKLISFSDKYRDAAPYLSPDGSKLFFDSRRPAKGIDPQSINLWYSQRDESGNWQTPKFLRKPSENKPSEGRAGQDEFGPAVDANGKLYFYSFRQPYRGGAHYSSTGPDYQDVQLETQLPNPSAPTFISYLYISPNAEIAIIEGRAKGRRDNDLFCACKQADGTWTAASPIEEVNTRFGEGVASLTPDGAFLIFASNRPTDSSTTATSNLYIIGTDQLSLPCKLPINSQIE